MISRKGRRFAPLWVCTGLGMVLGVGMVGCGPALIRPSASWGAAGRPSSYSDREWSAVLAGCVRDGLVDYARLAEQADALGRYYGPISVVGPKKTPEQFTSPAERTAYWINVYNALVLIAVRQHYPVSTMYDLALPRLEHDYWFLVDGVRCNLDQIMQETMTGSGGDVRVLFAMSTAARGTPRLRPEPYRAESLDAQLQQAAERALDSPDLLRIDHAGKTILVWQLVLRREADFLAYWRRQRRVETAFLFNVLLDLASPERRRQLQGAVGYTIRPMFDRRLNAWDESVAGQVP